MEVGEIKWVASVELAKARRQIKAFTKEINRSKLKFDDSNLDRLQSKIAKLNNSKIKPTVDFTQLHELNKLLDKKLSHYKRVQQYFKNNPLEIEYREKRGGGSRSVGGHGNDYTTEVNKIAKEVTEIKGLLKNPPPPAPVGSINQANQLLRDSLVPLRTVSGTLLRFAGLLTAKTLFTQFGQPVIASTLRAIAKVANQRQQNVSRSISSGFSRGVGVRASSRDFFTQSINRGRTVTNQIKADFFQVSSSIDKTIDKGRSVTQEILNKIERISNVLDRTIDRGRTVSQEIGRPIGRTIDRGRTVSQGLGIDIQSGLFRGLSINDVRKKGQEIGKSLLDETKRILGIQSPSKVFEEQVGQPIVQGIEKGLDFIDQIQPPFKNNLKKFLKELHTEVNNANTLISQQLQGFTLPNRAVGTTTTGISLGQTVGQAFSVGGFAVDMLRDQRQVFEQRKAGKLDLGLLESEINKVSATLNDEVKKNVIVAIDGISGNSQKARNDLDSWLRTTFKGVDVFTEELQSSDLSFEELSEPIAAFQKTIDRFNRFYVQGETNPDALRVAARIAAISRQSPGSNIQAIGRGVGGNVVQEALFILEQAGINANVSGYGMGTIANVTPIQPGNFKSRVPKASSVRGLGVNEQGMIDFYKFFKENTIKGIIVNPILAGLQGILPPVAAYRASMGLINTTRKRSKLFTRGIGENEVIQDINQALGNVTPGLGRLNAPEGLAGLPIRGLNTVLGVGQGIKDYTQAVRSEEELLRIRLENADKAKESIKGSMAEIEQIQLAGFGSIFGFLRGSITRLIALFGLFSAGSLAFTFIEVLPSQIEALGLAYAQQIEPIKNIINALSANANAFEEISKASLELGISLTTLSQNYQDFLFLAKTQLFDEAQARTMVTGIGELAINRAVPIQSQQAIFDQFQRLLSNNSLETSSFYQLERLLPGVVETLRTNTRSGSISELIDAVNSGQTNNVEAIGQLIEQLRIQSYGTRDSSLSTAVQAQSSLNAVVEQFQQEIGEAGIDEFYFAIIEIQKVALKAIKTILKALLDLFDFIAVGGVVASIAALGKVLDVFLRKLTDPKLLGVNLWDKFYDSLTVVSPQLAAVPNYLARITVFTKALIGTALPVIGITGIVTGLMEAFKSFNAEATKTRQNLNIMREAYQVILDPQAATPSRSTSLNFRQGNPLQQFIQNTIGLLNPYGSRNIFQEITRTALGGLPFDRASGGSINVAPTMTAEQVAVAKDRRRAMAEMQDLFSLIQQSTPLFKLDDTELKEIRQEIIDIDSRLSTARVNLAQAVSVSNFSEIDLYKDLIKELQNERKTILDSNFGDIAAIRASVQALRNARAEELPFLAGAGLSESSFFQTLNNLQDEDPLNAANAREYMAALEPLIAQRGFKSVFDFADYLRNLNKQINEGESALNKYNEQVKVLQTRLNKITSSTSRPTQVFANRLFQQGLQFAGQRGAALDARLSGGLSSSALNRTNLNISRSEVQARIDALGLQQQGFGANIGNTDIFSSSAIDSFKNIFGLSGNLLDGIQRYSPETILSTVQALANVDEKFNPALLELAKQVSQYVRLNQDILGATNERKRIEIQITENDRQRSQQLRQFARQEQNLDVTIFNFVKNGKRQLENLAKQEADFVRQSGRAIRDFAESFADFQQSIVRQLLESEKELIDAKNNLERTQLNNELNSLLNPSGGSIFEGTINLIDELIANQNQFATSEIDLNLNRLSSEEQILNISRQIRGFEEQRVDLARQQLEQERQLQQQRADFYQQQATEWNNIERQVEDMATQARQLGVNFDTTVTTFKGISTTIEGISKFFTETFGKIKTMWDELFIGPQAPSPTNTTTSIPPLPPIPANIPLMDLAPLATSISPSGGSKTQLPPPTTGNGDPFESYTGGKVVADIKRQQAEKENINQEQLLADVQKNTLNTRRQLRQEALRLSDTYRNLGRTLQNLTNDTINFLHTSTRHLSIEDQISLAVQESNKQFQDRRQQLEDQQRALTGLFESISSDTIQESINKIQASSLEETTQADLIKMLEQGQSIIPQLTDYITTFDGLLLRLDAAELTAREKIKSEEYATATNTFLENRAKLYTAIAEAFQGTPEEQSFLNLAELDQINSKYNDLSQTLESMKNSMPLAEFERMSTLLDQARENQIDEIGTKLQQLSDVLRGPFESFFSSMITNFTNWLDALSSLVNGISNNLARIASEFATNSLLSLFGIGGNTGSPAGALGIISGSSRAIPTFAYGGTVGGSFSNALRSEGIGATPIIATKGEEVLSLRNGDAQFYRKLKANKYWQKLKNGMASGFSSGNNSEPSFRRASTLSYQPVFNITTPDALSFRKSRSRIAQEEKLQNERAKRFI